MAETPESDLYLHSKRRKKRFTKRWSSDSYISPFLFPIMISLWIDEVSPGTSSLIAWSSFVYKGRQEGKNKISIVELETQQKFSNFDGASVANARGMCSKLSYLVRSTIQLPCTCLPRNIFLLWNHFERWQNCLTDISDNSSGLCIFQLWGCFPINN